MDSPYHPDFRFRIAYDNTSLAMLKECPRKYQYAILENWRPLRQAPPLAFGGALHDALETYDRTSHTGHEPALRAAVRKAMTLAQGWGDMPKDQARNAFTLVRSVVWYCDHYQSDPLETLILSNGKPALELSFRFQLPTSVAGHPIFYCGHIDKIATWAGQPCIQERKHTTMALTDFYFSRYKPNSQLCGYVTAANILFVHTLNTAIVDVCGVTTTTTTLARQPVTYTKSQLDEWLEDTLFWINFAETCARHNHYPQNTESCHKYGGCQFRTVCSHSPSLRPNFLATYFHQVEWNPLTIRGE